MTQKRNANPDKLINWFDDFGGPNKYRFLSNFFVGDPIDMNDGYGAIYRTGEHAFAAYKAANYEDFDKVVQSTNPGQAKGIGRRIELRKDWEVVKYDVMRAVLAAKFHPDRIEAEWLLATGDALLVEGTDWNDRVWGVSNENKRGRNWLGHLLMAQRALLRSGLAETAYPNRIGVSVLAFATPFALDAPRPKNEEGNDAW